MARQSTQSPLSERWVSRRVVVRMPQVVAGIVILGVGVGMMAQGDLGFGPWAVLAEGIGKQADIALGTASILVGLVVLMSWFIVRVRPGIATVANVMGVGLVINASIEVLPVPDTLWGRLPMTVGGVVAVGLGIGLYLAADLGPGPRDGLTTGLHHKLGWSIRRVRTTIEVTVLVVGFLLGGTIGLGTVLMALAVGPVMQAALSVLDREGRVMHRAAAG
ncbi:MAG: YczE/YyaS/YitT family protein [Acidimicrobiia bacterium]